MNACKQLWWSGPGDMSLFWLFAAALRLGVDHERVAPNGLRLIGILFTLLPQSPAEAGNDVMSWLETAQRAIVEGILSRSMKVTHLS